MGPGSRLRQLASLHVCAFAAMAFVFSATAVEAQSSLNAAWESLGPTQVESLRYGKVTGRVTALSIDSTADATGNTVYLGTTGGGVWKSTNALGAASAVTFTPLTDNLPVFSANAGTVAVPSLSIGAIAAVNNIVLAGTGDPSNAADSFYGVGILRSADGGLTWTLVQDSDDGVYGYHSFVGLAFAGFAWSTTSTGTVVAAVTSSAEAALVGAVSATDAVMGLYVSTDYGVTWKMATVVDGATVVQRAQAAGANHGGNAATAVVWNPVRKKFYAALRYHGYYESSDGVTWTRVTSQPGAGLTTAACPANTNTVGSNGCPIFRGTLAVESVSGDLYALTVDGANRDLGIWRDVCAKSGSACASSTVSFAQRVGGTSLEAGSGSTVVAQGDYNLSLAAVSTGSSGDTLLFAGTVDLYRCALSSCSTMRNTTNALNACNAPAKVAPAQHALAAWATTGQPTIFAGNDGGLWRSTDGVDQQGTACSSDDATHFENLNGALGSLAMVQTLAHDPTDAATLLAGIGANGTAATAVASASGTVPWLQLAAGEGGGVAIDPANPAQWYLSTAAGVNIARCTKGIACAATDFNSPVISSTQVGGDVALPHAAWLLDPGTTSSLIAGTCRVWRGQAEGGGLWSSANAISAMLAGTPQPACLAANGLIRSLAAGGAVVNSPNAQNMGSKVIYAGMAGTLSGGAGAGGHVFVTQVADTATNATAWSDITSSPVTKASVTSAFNAAGYDISSLAVDTHDATGRTVYATIRGFGVARVYRSTTGGAGWTNVSANLPDAPANAVLVDPNDANTVYVAMDTGVYVTSNVTSCETANCWSSYGTGLPNAPAMAMAIGGALPTSDGRVGELRVATYGRGVWQAPLLTASSSTTAPAITFSASSLSFASQSVGTISTAQTLTVTNSGTAPLTVSRIVISKAQLPLGPQAEFSETDSCIGSAIAIGQSCTMQVRFAPAATGSRSATMTIYANVSGGQAMVTLTGTATPGGAVVLTPLSLVFGQTSVNATSAVQNITVANTGTGSTTLGTAAVTGNFLITANTCEASLAVQTSCTISVAFRPTASGARTGSLTILADGTTLTSSLSGSGVLPATDALSPLSLTYGPQMLGTTSLAQQVTLTNAGDVALTLISATATGDFAVSNGCGNSLAAHASCAMTVVFQPKSLGQATGVLTVSDETRSQTVALTGTGIAPAGVSLSPLFSMAFPATGVGLVSAPQTVTLTNNGGVVLAISSVALSGDFAMVPSSTTCGATLAVGSACMMQVVFQPTVGGTRNGTLTLTSNASNSPHNLALSGPGVEFTLTPDGMTTATVASGQTASYLLLYTAGAAVSGANVALNCSGVPQYASCRLSPATLTVDGNATVVTVTVVTGTTTALWRQPAGVALALALGPAGWFALRRRRSMVALLGVCLLLAAQGCGAGRTIPGSSSGGSGSGITTPSGSYHITVTASGYGLTRTVGLTLKVQ